jgi:hypothetical protein
VNLKSLLLLIAVTLMPFEKSVAETDTGVNTQSVAALPQLIDRVVPRNLSPSLNNIKSDRPKPYKDRCHTQQNLEKSVVSCEYGNIQSTTSIVLFGDSHALSWFPAIERLAIAKKWKLISLTMSSCWPADIPAWNSTTNQVMNNCEIWRAETLNDIVALRPKMIFVAGTRGFATTDHQGKLATGKTRITLWEEGITRTLEQLKRASNQVIYLGDTPISQYDVATCLPAHPDSVAKCSTPYKKAVSVTWLAEEKSISDAEKVVWIDPTPWICATDPCSPILGRYEIFVDSGHLTASFAWTLERPLWADLTGA